MNNIIIELSSAKPINAIISDDDRFSIKNAMVSKAVFISFTDTKSKEEWIIRTDDIVTVNIASGDK